LTSFAKVECQSPVITTGLKIRSFCRNFVIRVRAAGEPSHESFQKRSSPGAWPSSSSSAISTWLPMMFQRASERLRLFSSQLSWGGPSMV
jgi:hypothetical protein